MTTLALFLLLQEGVTLSVPAEDQDRRYVVAEAAIPAARLAPPFRLKDKESGTAVACQWEAADGAHVVRWLVPEIPARARRAYVLERGEPSRADGLTLKEERPGLLSVRAPDREITRYWYAEVPTPHKKPFFYPLNAAGVNVLRGYPIEDREGEAKDHPHHTGIYFAFGEVNGREYWSKLPIQHQRLVKKEAGPVYARIEAENAWGEDLVERRDVLIFNAGADAVMDWSVTLTAAKGPVVLAKDKRMAKEGCFAVRVATGLTDKARKDPGMNLMSDAKGNKGENAIRADTAPWVHYTGDVDGKRVGVAVFQHPSSFRYPTNWHVRAYGLFAANPFLVAGEHTLEKGQSIHLRYRVYVHSGDPAAGKVPAVFAGYAHAKASVE